MSDKRGLVLPWPTVALPDGSAAPGELDTHDLRIALLFFDFLDCPTSFPVVAPLGLDAEFLKEAGVYKRTRVIDRNKIGPGIVRSPFWECFCALDDEQPGVWTMSTKNLEDVLEPAALKAGRAVLFQLHQAIPVPDKDVALEDLLKFRERRRSELLALRVQLEEAFQVVRDASDQPLAWNTQLTKLTQAINAQLRVSRESGLRFKVGSIDWTVNLTERAAAVGAALATGLPITQALQIGLAGALPSIAISLKGGVERKRSEPTPFTYVARIHNELLIGE